MRRLPLLLVVSLFFLALFCPISVSISRPVERLAMFSRSPPHALMEQPAARNAYCSKCGSLCVDSVQAKPLESRTSPRNRPRREGSTVRPVEARIESRRVPIHRLFCRLCRPASVVPKILCGRKCVRWSSYLLGSLGDNSPLLPWLSVEDGLPSRLSFPSFPQHFTSLCLCEHTAGQQTE